MAKKEYKEEIAFVHEGKKLLFKTEPNPLNNAQMWWVEPLHTMYHGTVIEVKKIAKNIKAHNSQEA